MTSKNTKPQADEQNQSRFQRKIIFIKKGMQLKIIALVLFSFLFGISLTSFGFLSLAEDVFARHPVLLHVFFEKGAGVFLLFGILILVSLAILTLAAAVLSNKVAGPLYRFEVAFKDVASGKFSTRIKLRQGDSMRGLEKEFNAMMDIVENKLNENNKAA
ncbi:MAG: hypothetical protein LBM71_01390 [Elusimicrobiota bacterium]|nr:hypothetical protein [Elusimicrobiota bacterium]